ncbi:MAG: alpha/beta hydrolase, partial [Acetobacteraceae bacterium]
ITAEGAAWGLDPARIVVGGDSAGANLAAGLALSLRDGPAPLPLRGLLLNYGVFDSRLDTPSYREFATGYGLTEEKMRFYWEAYAPRPADRLNPLAAPLRAELTGLPPCLLHIAELDVLAQENHAMDARLRAAGVAVETAHFPGTVHGFLRAVGRVAAADRSVAEAAAWLRARFG